MIGNTIEFVEYIGSIDDRKPVTQTGLVIDAFTEVYGSVSGKTSGILGFVDGGVSGITQSRRKYKVQFYEWWDNDKKLLQIKRHSRLATEKNTVFY